MIAFLSILGLVVLVIALAAERRFDYGKTHRYRARQDRKTGKVQIFVREWMPAAADENTRVTFARNHR